MPTPDRMFTQISNYLLAFGQQNFTAFGNSNFEDQPGAGQNDDFNMDSNGFGEDAFTGDNNQANADEYKPTGDPTSFIPEDAEERERIEAAKKDQEERLRAIREREEQEITQKREKKNSAKEELNDWYDRK